VHFTFKGNTKFKTAYGAFFSIIIKIIMLILITYELYLIFSRKHPVISINEILNNMDDTNAGMDPFKYGFDISIGILTTDKISQTQLS